MKEAVDRDLRKNLPKCRSLRNSVHPNFKDNNTSETMEGQDIHGRQVQTADWDLLNLRQCLVSPPSHSHL